MKLFRIRKIVINSETMVPRMYCYFNERKETDPIGIPGYDYLGYVILDYEKEKPYIIENSKTRFLTENEIDEMKEVIKNGTPQHF